MTLLIVNDVEMTIKFLTTKKKKKKAGRITCHNL